MADFTKYKIKDYKFWSVFIHENQCYLGRCVVFCNRQDASDLTDATPEENKELLLVLKKLKKALVESFHPDWFNFAFSGNETKHLHCHVIPRYEKPREFEGIIFRDERYGHNYRTDHGFILPPSVFKEIKTRIEKAL